ncbi:hypothetical protein HNY73_006131 [Argiope bruennichi]|uniref:Uncharacterized protein n=1 Tax=Argiope bruennichi TaxID=94029 RepID=A0A8T0FLH5_ARGBR|nr:hypothetical protein HNY73_006131 [Argiope bruennichi]
MDRKNVEIFSPIKNFDEGKNKRRTDSFSKFLKGPEAFKNSSTKAEENVNEEILSIKNIASKTVQDKSTESEVISSFSQDDSFVSCPGSDNSLKKVDKSDNSQSCSSKKKDLSNTFVTAIHKEINQQSDAERNTERKHASSTNSLQLHSIENSVQPAAIAVSETSRTKEIRNTNPPSSLNQHKQSSQSGTAVVSETSGSKEIKKTDYPSSLSQRNPLSQIQSRIEKMVSDALETQVENLHQLMWYHHCNLLKALYANKETLEHRQALERETLCKIMEELAEENRQLRNAAFDQ